MASITCSPAPLDCPPFPTALHALDTTSTVGPPLMAWALRPEMPTWSSAPLSRWWCYATFKASPAATTCDSVSQPPRLVSIAGSGALAQNSQGTSHPPSYTWGPLVLCQAHCAGLTSPLLTCLHVPRQLLCPNPTVFSKVVFISKNLQFRGML